MDLDVLMLTNNDWANIGYEFAKCLRLLGLNVKFLKGRKHPSYPVQGEIHPAITNGAIGNPELTILIGAPELQPLAEEAHVVHYTSSTFVSTGGVDLQKKHVVVQHDGDVYYQEHVAVNRLFNGFADVTILHAPNMFGHNAKKEVWIANPVDTDTLQPDFYSGGKIRIGHFPSSPTAKGTVTVLRAIEILESDHNWNNKFQYEGVRLNSDNSYTTVDWQSNLRRIKRCDILIEACNPGLIREPGTTALEAAALGTVVVSNSHNTELYEKEYGERALHIANDQDELVGVLKSLISLSAMDLLDEQHNSRMWVVQYHSFDAVARRLWDKVYNERFYRRVGDELVRC